MRLQKSLDILVVAVFFLAMWQLVASTFGLPDYIMASPKDAIGVIIGESYDGFLKDFGTTLAEALLGVIVANVAAYWLIALFEIWSPSKRFVLPIAIALKATPVVALAPLMVMWLGTGFVMKVVTASLVGFFPFLIGVSSALDKITVSEDGWARAIKPSNYQLFQKVRMPLVMPQAFSALKISVTLCTVGAIVGEFVSSSIGLGTLVVVASNNLRPDLLFAGIIGSAFCGGTLYLLVVLFEMILLRRWRLQNVQFTKG